MTLQLSALASRLLHWFRDKKNSGPKKLRLELEQLEERSLLTGGTWTLVNPAPARVGQAWLMTDGRVLAQTGGPTGFFGNPACYMLTPDASGNYANGTWTQVASMHDQRHSYGSAVLPDGRLFVVGGETNDSGIIVNIPNAEIYDPVANTWTEVAPFPLLPPPSHAGDLNAMLLPNGKVLVDNNGDGRTEIYDPATNTWSPGGTKLHGANDEETWIKLPDQSILTYDITASLATGVNTAERYVPPLNQWVDAGTVPVPLTSNAGFTEIGPGFLLPNSKALQLGHGVPVAHNGLYDPATNTWTQAPDTPNGLSSDDTPGAEMPNGNVIFVAETVLFMPPRQMFEYDWQSNTIVPVAGGPNLNAAGDYRMLVLPSGQVLYTDYTTQPEIFTPNSGPANAWRPVISGISNNGDGSYTLTGTQLNGMSQGANYGDEAQEATNYPIVRLVDTAGKVFYARTFNWDNTGVQTGGALEHVRFTLPAGINPNGTYSLSVIGSGIASHSVSFTPGQQAGIFIDAGGGAVGNFAADEDFSGGSTYATSAAIDTSQVSNPAPQAVYQTERYGNFTYTVGNLTAGASYTVRLDFAEIYWNAAGQRLFNVAINGNQVLSNFDIFATAGGADIAIAKTFTATADSSGQIVIQFSTIQDNAKVSGIEITPAQAQQSVFIATGSSVSIGNFAANEDFSGGSGPYTVSNPIDTSGVSNPAPQAVYQGWYTDNPTYTIPNLTPGASYHVRLDFSENAFNAEGQRVFNVSINGTQVLTNFDVFKAAGDKEFKAVAEDFVATADASGKITIAFTTVVGTSRISGIEITPATLGTQSVFIAAGSSSAVGNFSADVDFNGTGLPNGPVPQTIDLSGVSNPPPQALFQSFRNNDPTYVIPNLTPGAAYHVRLYFAEVIANGPGQRVFNVAINGNQVLANFDPFAAAGGMNKAVAEDLTAFADASGQITITFTTVIGNSRISGIEITPA
jgi:hypothetical protein